MFAKPQQEHEWLKRFIGAWVVEMECSMGPGQPPQKMKGRETVRAFGGLWIIGEGESDGPDGSACKSQLLLGYDPVKKMYTGSFVAEPMAHLWIYEGTLEPDGVTLPLRTEGPSMAGNGQAKYIDTHSFLSPDHRTLVSQLQDEKGQWSVFMTAHYRRAT